jgi:hypothetical protein
MTIDLSELDVDRIAEKVLETLKPLLEDLREPVSMELLNKKQSCKYLSVCNDTFDKYIKSNLRGVKIGKETRYTTRELNEYLGQAGHGT